MLVIPIIPVEGLHLLRLLNNHQSSKQSLYGSVCIANLTSDVWEWNLIIPVYISDILGLCVTAPFGRAVHVLESKISPRVFSRVHYSGQFFEVSSCLFRDLGDTYL